MFFGGAILDLQIIIFLLGISLLISLISVYFLKRKVFSIILFSILTNAIFLAAEFTKSDLFDFYNIVWLLYFSVFVWPILNIFLIAYYIRTRPKK